jgi:hypothetical protein
MVISGKLHKIHVVCADVNCFLLVLYLLALQLSNRGIDRYNLQTVNLLAVRTFALRPTLPASGARRPYGPTPLRWPPVDALNER